MKPINSDKITAEWDAQRAQFEQYITQQITQRGNAQGWFDAKGKLSKKGGALALEFVIGMASALEMIDHNAKAWMLSQAFLCSVRGVDSRFPQHVETRLLGIK